jgi:hypothetical protein
MMYVVYLSYAICGWFVCHPSFLSCLRMVCLLSVFPKLFADGMSVIRFVFPTLFVDGLSVINLS